jgi:hypothetical protein
MGYELTHGYEPLVQVLEKVVLLFTYLGEFMKVAKPVVVHIMGFVKDVFFFSILTFVKSRFQKRLCEHLDLVV